MTTNFNSTNAYDIEDEAEATDGDIYYLQEVGYHIEEEEDEASELNLNNILSDLIMMEEEYSQYSQGTTQISQADTQNST